MPFHTIADEWVEFASNVLPDDVSEIQRSEMRKAFFGGCQAMLTLVSVIADQSNSEEAGAIEMERLSQELIKFGQDVIDGKA